MSDIEAVSNLYNYEWLCDQSQENYKRSRSFVGIDEDLVRLYSGASAYFGEEAFKLASKSEKDRFMAIVLGNYVVDGYFIAERFTDVLRFSNDYLTSLGESVPQSIVGGIDKLRAVSLGKLSEQNLNPQPTDPQP